MLLTKESTMMGDEGWMGIICCELKAQGTCTWRLTTLSTTIYFLAFLDPKPNFLK